VVGACVAAAGVIQTAVLHHWWPPSDGRHDGVNRGAVLALPFLLAAGCFVLDAFRRIGELGPWRWLWLAALVTAALGCFWFVSQLGP
jgi:hypothetical protein